MPNVVGVRFRKACRIYDFECDDLMLSAGDNVIVETEKGIAFATVVYGPLKKYSGELQRPLKKIIRKADKTDLERLEFNEERKMESLRICREKITQYNLPMKLIDVEYLFDSSKAIFYFLSESRVDFRELVRDLANEFHTRIEMKQVGVRDRSKMLGGIGPCGRELCCSSFLTDFEPVTVKMAKKQNVPLAISKISGLCGRLMCCLTYEYGAYQSVCDAQPADEINCNGCH